MGRAKNDRLSPQLLPIGLGDLLPAEAEKEEAILRKIADYFGACGYARVKPPLLEFADSHNLERSFRVMDPLSHDSRLMSLRADMTVQVARIATERLSRAARPLRLFYSGEVLRIKGSQVRPRRQFRQIGAEIIGTGGNPQATVEILAMAATALQNAIGKKAVSFDLSLPLLVAELLSSANDSERDSLSAALQVRDYDFLRRHRFKHAGLLADVTMASGDYAAAVRMLDKVQWTKAALPLYKRLKAVARAVQKQKPDMRISVDIAENLGFDYQSGLSFTIYGKGLKGALGRGGEYPAGRAGESACGVSFYMDSVLQIAPDIKAGRRVLLAKGAAPALVEKYRKSGVAAVALQAKNLAGLKKQAESQGYNHVYHSGKLHKL